MNDTAIHVRGLGKRYRIGKREAYRTLRESLMSTLAAPLRQLRAGASSQTNEDDGENSFWALKDVDFDIRRGEVVGVIGRNGAGKSTLLKVLSRITEPTTGRIEIRGRVGSLLEVGTGFHPELTGRENVFLNGAILGMKRTEIARKFDEIVAFAEIDQFLDTPVKHYSSGMYMRLAFAVAAHLEPEILIVDEVLAVGDVAFQRKCLGRMSVVANEGRTVLFVSHDMGAIEAICQRALLLRSGSVAFSGGAAEVVQRYLQDGVERGAVVGNASCSIDQMMIMEVEDGHAIPTSSVRLGGDFAIAVDYSLKRPLTTGASIRVATPKGTVLFDCHEFMGSAPPRAEGTYRTTFRFDGHPLAPGLYFVSAYLMVHHGQAHLAADSFFSFEVVGTLEHSGGHSVFDLGGVLFLHPTVSTENIHPTGAPVESLTCSGG